MSFFDYSFLEVKDLEADSGDSIVARMNVWALSNSTKEGIE